MLDEAKATRERVLADLLRRRTLLQAQIEEFRGGRDNLLDAYRVVKRTFLEATDALAQVEARAAAERAAQHTSVAEVDQPDELIDGADPSTPTPKVQSRCAVSDSADGGRRGRPDDRCR